MQIFRVGFLVLLFCFPLRVFAGATEMKKYYLGIEDRYSMNGQTISETFLVVERSSVENVRSIFEKMLVNDFMTRCFVQRSR